MWKKKYPTKSGLTWSYDKQNLLHVHYLCFLTFWSFGGCVLHMCFCSVSLASLIWTVILIIYCSAIILEYTTFCKLTVINLCLSVYVFTALIACVTVSDPVGHLPCFPTPYTNTQTTTAFENRQCKTFRVSLFVACTTPLTQSHRNHRLSHSRHIWVFCKTPSFVGFVLQSVGAKDPSRSHCDWS